MEWVSTLELNDPGMSQVFISRKYHISVIYLLFVMTNDKCLGKMQNLLNLNNLQKHGSASLS